MISSSVTLSKTSRSRSSSSTKLVFIGIFLNFPNWGNHGVDFFPQRWKARRAAFFCWPSALVENDLGTSHDHDGLFHDLPVPHLLGFSCPFEYLSPVRVFSHCSHALHPCLPRESPRAVPVSTPQVVVALAATLVAA